MRMQQALCAGATEAAAKAVAVGQQSASTMSTAVARASWRVAPVIWNNLESFENELDAKSLPHNLR
jgi:hypothetical protein